MFKAEFYFEAQNVDPIQYRQEHPLLVNVFCSCIHMLRCHKHKDWYFVDTVIVFILNVPPFFLFILFEVSCLH